MLPDTDAPDFVPNPGPLTGELAAAFSELSERREELRVMRAVGRPTLDEANLSRVLAYDGNLANLPVVTATLWGISLHCNDASVGSLLAREAIWFQHEVRTRRSWVKYHEDCLSKGVSVEEPFRCGVGPRGYASSRKEDREYFTLLLLAQWMYRLEGRQILFERKGETPDFVVREAGTELGVEAAEATDRKRGRRQARHDEVFALISEAAVELGQSMHVELAGLGCAASGISRHYGSLLHVFWSKRQEIVDELRSRVVKNERECEFTEGRRFRLSVSCPTGRFSGVFYTDPRGTIGSEIRDANAEACGLVETTVGDKLVKPGKTPKARLKPNTRPCLLAIYVNPLSVADLGEVFASLRTNWKVDASSHFDEVWLVHEQHGCRVT